MKNLYTPYLHYLLNGETNPTIEFVVASLNESMNNGNSCLDINNFVNENNLNMNEVIYNICQSSFVVKVNFSIEIEEIPNIPILLVEFKDNYLLYINRYFYYEKHIVRNINLLNCKTQPINTTDLLFQKISFVKQTLSSLSTNKSFPNHDQLDSIISSLSRKFSIITGGPGTGKTTSVFFLLWSFQQMYGDNISLNICAPTGKASKRIKESLLFNINSFANITGLEVNNLLQIINKTDIFGTIHKTLGVILNNIYFRHNASKKLAIDILFIDESSMIGLPVFYKLIDAIDSETIKHIIFLGDSNQLSSVEEGYVFSSLVNNAKNSDYLNELKISNRNKGDIAKFSNAILYNKIADIKSILTNSSEIQILPPSLYQIINNSLDKNSNFIKLVECANNFDQSSYEQLFSLLTDSTILCMTNVGYLGTKSLNYQIEARIKNIYKFNTLWYPGRIIIILENDSSEKNLSQRLYNGDIGVCVMRNKKPSIYFDEGRSFIPERLPKYDLAFAISIHKSQGSEYDNVSIVIPNNYNKILRKELVYTAITRTKKLVKIYSNPDTLIKAINIDGKRISGLQYLLEN